MEQYQQIQRFITQHHKIFLDNRLKGCIEDQQIKFPLLKSDTFQKFEIKWVNNEQEPFSCVTWTYVLMLHWRTMCKPQLWGPSSCPPSKETKQAVRNWVFFVCWLVSSDVIQVHRKGSAVSSQFFCSEELSWLPLPLARQMLRAEREIERADIPSALKTHDSRKLGYY